MNLFSAFQTSSPSSILSGSSPLCGSMSVGHKNESKTLAGTAMSQVKLQRIVQDHHAEDEGAASCAIALVVNAKKSLPAAKLAPGHHPTNSRCNSASEGYGSINSPCSKALSKPTKPMLRLRRRRTVRITTTSQTSTTKKTPVLGARNSIEYSSFQNIGKMNI